MKLSVLISTKNRPKDLAECINSVVSQSVKPIEIILVDAGEGDENKKLAEELLQGTGIEFAYEKQEVKDRRVRKTAAWNRACKSARGDVIVFLDDDVVLERDYIFYHLKVYEDSSLGYVAGVQGFIEEEGGVKTNVGNWNTFFRRLFFLPTYHKGGMLPSGFPSFHSDTSRVTSLEAMQSGNMSLRKEIFNEFQFDEWFHGYSYQEDDDLTYRISRKYNLYQTPYAKMVHKCSPSGRESRAEQHRIRVVNHYYFFRKNMPKNLKTWLCFFWSELGHLVLLVFRRNRDREAIKGRMHGLYQVVKAITVNSPLDA